MTEDPRHKNQKFNMESVSSYLHDYAQTLARVLNEINPTALAEAAQILVRVRQTRARVFVAGNGGSAAIAEHLGCDWQKGVYHPGRPSLHVHGLTSNAALWSAIANDFGFAKSFSYQLEMAEIQARDVLVLISSSGNSENIVAAAEVAKNRGATIIGLSGFSGGRLKQMADISLHVACDNYGVIEDAHQALMHVLAQHHDFANP